MAVYLLFNNPSGCPSCGKQVSKTYIQSLQNVANNYTLADDVGYGVLVPGAYSNLPKVVNGTPFTVDGKPEVFYVGGEFCPYCAITRWGLVLALMRFGNFTNLTYMESSAKDIDPDTPTFSFVNSSYSSNLVHFDGFEIYSRDELNITNNGYTEFYQTVYGKYSTGGIPFVDFANSSVQNGASVNPILLRNSDWNQVLVNISNPNSAMAQAIIGNANIFTAYICKSSPTLNSTAVACRQNYVKAIIG